MNTLFHTYNKTKIVDTTRDEIILPSLSSLQIYKKKTQCKTMLAFIPISAEFDAAADFCKKNNKM